ncbi:MAG: hypothetical protein PHU56_00065 [Candidatus Pacebacteria bacterium]|nr:hypothetical protein [Candidatus Paceibacterota bacterium]
MNAKTIISKTKTPESPDVVFEVAWEVGNKVGGIWTVLVSKVEQMIKHYPENYFLLGPYFAEKLKGEFEEEPPEENIKDVFKALEQEQGLRFHWGKWLIKGEPRIILIDFKDFWPRANQIKTDLWSDDQIDSITAGNDFTEPVVWATACGLLIEKLAELFPGKKAVAHFHEWLSGTGLLYLGKKQPRIGTVFTTHATTLGRTLAYNNVDFYGFIDSINPEEEINRFNIKAKHQLEKAVTHQATVFTTVSAITAWEAEHFLGRKADLLLPNGLSESQFPSFEEITIQHRAYRNRLRNFLLFYFFPYYAFDLEQTLFFFTACRYEFRAKGLDIFIKSLALLNEKMRESHAKKTVVAFFLVPSGVRGIKTDILESREFLEDIKNSLEEISHETQEKVLYALAEDKEISEETLFNKDFLFNIEKKFLKLKRKGTPPLSTHDLLNEHDPILNLLQESGLDNKPDDKVKVVFYPIYLSGHDGLANLTYEEFLKGSHLGVFPSFYEPWGYTTLETAGYGVPALTSDLTGFGRACQKYIADKKYPGVFLLKRTDTKDEEAVESLADILFTFSQYQAKERVENKIHAKDLSVLFGWKKLVKNYFKAHQIAIKNK